LPIFHRRTQSKKALSFIHGRIHDAVLPNSQIVLLLKGKRKSYLLRIDEDVWNERKKLNPRKQSVGL
jgi:hypothetical protein